MALSLVWHITGAPLLGKPVSIPIKRVAYDCHGRDSSARPIEQYIAPISASRVTASTME